jgi:hypothetical protein
MLIQEAIRCLMPFLLFVVIGAFSSCSCSETSLNSSKSTGTGSSGINSSLDTSRDVQINLSDSLKLKLEDSLKLKLKLKLKSPRRPAIRQHASASGTNWAVIAAAPDGTVIAGTLSGGSNWTLSLPTNRSWALLFVVEDNVSSFTGAALLSYNDGAPSFRMGAAPGSGMTPILLGTPVISNITDCQLLSTVNPASEVDSTGSGIPDSQKWTNRSAFDQDGDGALDFFGAVDSDLSGIPDAAKIYLGVFTGSATNSRGVLAVFADTNLVTNAAAASSNNVSILYDSLISAEPALSWYGGTSAWSNSAVVFTLATNLPSLQEVYSGSWSNLAPVVTLSPQFQSNIPASLAASWSNTAAAVALQSGFTNYITPNQAAQYSNLQTAVQTNAAWVSMTNMSGQSDYFLSNAPASGVTPALNVQTFDFWFYQNYADTNSRVTNFNLYVNGNFYQSIVYNTNASVIDVEFQNVVFLNTGSNSVYCQAVLTNGTTVASASLAVNVNSLAAVSILYPSNGMIVPSTFDVIGTANFVPAAWYLWGNDAFLASATPNGTNWDILASGLAAGSYSLQFQDSSSSVTGTVSVTVDNTLPYIYNAGNTSDGYPNNGDQVASPVTFNVDYQNPGSTYTIEIINLLVDGISIGSYSIDNDTNLDNSQLSNNPLPSGLHTFQYQLEDANSDLFNSAPYTLFVTNAPEANILFTTTDGSATNIVSCAYQINFTSLSAYSNVGALINGSSNCNNPVSTDTSGTNWSFNFNLQGYNVLQLFGEDQNSNPIGGTNTFYYFETGPM